MKTLLMSLSLMTIVSCSEKSQEVSNYTDNRDSLIEAQAIQSTYELNILDQYGVVVPAAQVMLGLEYSEEKFFQADENGQVKIPASLWSKAEAITVDAPGFVRLSYMGVNPSSTSFVLNAKTETRSFKVEGVTKGFGSLKKDKVADFSMVVPSFTKKHLIGFDLSYVISDQMDTMSVYGEDILVPSNVSFPKQKESYGIFPVTLDKPSYTMPFFFGGTYDLAAVHGRFPFKKVVKKMRKGASIFDVINDFEFKQVGFTKVEVSGSDHKIDLPINHISFDLEKKFKAPEFNKEDILMLISLNEREGGFFPSGIKKVNPEADFALKFAADFDHHMLAVLTQEEKGADSVTSLSSDMSIQVMELNKSSAINLLDKVSQPSVADEGLNLYPPENKEGVHSTGTYLSLTKFNDVANPHIEIIESQKQWEIYAGGWINDLRLPEWPAGLVQTEKLRWEVMFLGSDKEESSELGPNQIKRATHVSRNTVDL